MFMKKENPYSFFIFHFDQLYFFPYECPIAENTTVKRSSAISKHVSFWAGQIPAGQTSPKETIFEMAARAFYCCLYSMTYPWFGTKTKILIKQKLVLSFHDYQNKDVLPVQCTVSNWHKSAVGGLIHLVTDTSGVNSFNMENRNRDSHSIQILHIRMYVYIFISISAVKDHKTPGLLGVIKLT